MSCQPVIFAAIKREKRVGGERERRREKEKGERGRNKESVMFLLRRGRCRRARNFQGTIVY